MHAPEGIKRTPWSLREICPAGFAAPRLTKHSGIPWKKRIEIAKP
jgi:hypothetical protein